MFYLAREAGKFGHVLAKKKVTLKWLMKSNMVKPEKCGHLYLVNHFTITLSHKSRTLAPIFISKTSFLQHVKLYKLSYLELLKYTLY